MLQGQIVYHSVHRSIHDWQPVERGLPGGLWLKGLPRADLHSQVMDEESLTKHGPFYVTHTLKVYHSDIKDNGQVCGGGVSIYYSHALQLLFFSYGSGKSFVAPLKYVDDIDLVTLINVSTNSKVNNGGSSSSEKHHNRYWSLR